MSSVMISDAYFVFALISVVPHLSLFYLPYKNRVTQIETNTNNPVRSAFLNVPCPHATSSAYASPLSSSKSTSSRMSEVEPQANQTTYLFNRNTSVVDASRFLKPLPPQQAPTLSVSPTPLPSLSMPKLYIAPAQEP